MKKKNQFSYPFFVAFGVFIFATACTARKFHDYEQKTIVVVNPSETKVRLYWIEKEASSKHEKSENNRPKIEKNLILKSGFCGFTGDATTLELHRIELCQSDLKAIPYPLFVGELKNQIQAYKKANFVNVALSEEQVKRKKFSDLIEKLEAEVANKELNADVRHTAQVNLDLAAKWVGQLKAPEADSRWDALQNFDQENGLLTSVEKSLTRLLPIQYAYGRAEPVTAEGMIAMLIWKSFAAAFEASVSNPNVDESLNLNEYVLNHHIHLNFGEPLSFADKRNGVPTPRLVNSLPYLLFGKGKIFEKGDAIKISDGYKKIATVLKDFKTGLNVGEPYCKIEVPAKKIESGYEVSFRHIITGAYVHSPSNDAETSGLVFFRDLTQPTTLSRTEDEKVADIFFLRCGILTEESLVRVAGNANLDLLDFFGTFEEDSKSNTLKLSHLRSALGSSLMRLEFKGPQGSAPKVTGENK